MLTGCFGVLLDGNLKLDIETLRGVGVKSYADGATTEGEKESGLSESYR